MAPARKKDARSNKSLVDATLKRIGRKVESRLASFFDDLESEADEHRIFERSNDTPLLAQVRDLTLRGGKRLRAALLVSGACLFDPNAEDNPAVIDAAAAMELRQTYLLIHDDIMDEDSVRRGGPSVHVALTGYTGSSRLGMSLGILAGDLAAALEQLLLQKMDIDLPRLARVTQIFAEMHAAVVQGQALDLLGEVSALKVAIHKTATYTTIGPLAAGAALSGARDRDIEHLVRIAEPLGVAFQLRDDLLGTFGDPKLTGKPVGHDLLEGKQTVLLEEALAKSDRYQRKQIQAVLGNPNAKGKELDAARDAMVQCGAKAACERHIEELTEEFIAGLDRDYYNDGARRFLVGVARFIGERNA
jgi:geranylgeranyl diphosphate synthase type I